MLASLLTAAAFSSPFGKLALVGALALGILLLALMMRPRMYYFVRHGRTLLNEKNIKQGEEGGLAEVGKEQAKTLALSLEPVGINHIYSSPYERAKETAAIMKTYLRRGVTISKLLAERRNASTVIGKSADDPEVANVISLTDLRFHEDDYRYADEENFSDLKKRAIRALAYLATRPHRKVCVVTHHAILHMMLSVMLVGRRLDAVDYVKLSFFNPAENGGITVCVYYPWRGFLTGRGWEIVSYNQ